MISAELEDHLMAQARGMVINCPTQDDVIGRVKGLLVDLECVKSTHEQSMSGLQDRLNHTIDLYEKLRSEFSVLPALRGENQALKQQNQFLVNQQENMMDRIFNYLKGDR